MSKRCNECGSNREPYSVPYTILKDFKETSTKTIKMLFSVIIILVFLLVGTNCAWLWWNNQWETVEKLEITQENDSGYNNYIGNDGDIVNGETDNQKN